MCVGPIKALFKITADCNKDCAFCPDRPFASTDQKPLPLKDIAVSYERLRRRYSIDSVILSGGEPLLHPEYFSILKYFSRQPLLIRVVTNMTRFADEKFCTAHSRIFRKLPYRQIYGSVSSALKPGNSALAGLKRLLAAGIPPVIILVAHKDNVAILPAIVEDLVAVFAAAQLPLILELRMVYVSDMPSHVCDQAPQDPTLTIKSFRNSVQTAVGKVEKLIVWNFPACYLDRHYDCLHDQVEARRKVKVAKIDSAARTPKVTVRDFTTFLHKKPACSRCSCFDRCSGINKEYLERFGFPPLNPISNAPD